jgi:predicted DNA-binding transcriptional regulator AlpA
MFIERRLKDPKFPQPIKLGGRIRFFALDQIEAYERSRIRADEAA